MGLDAIEIVHSVEEHLDVRLDESDWDAFSTVGTLYTRILRKRGLFVEAPAWPCPNFARFDRVRDLLVERFGVDREEVRPRSALRSLIPAPVEEDDWSEFATALGIRIPRLTLDWSDQWILFLLTGLEVLLVVASLDGQWIGWVFAALWTVVAVFFVCLPRPVPSIDGTLTVETLVRLLAIDRSRLGDSMTQVDERRRIWNELTALLVGILHVDAEEVTPKAMLLHDLGME